MVDQFFSALVLLVCVVLLARLAMGAERRARLDAALRRTVARLRQKRPRRAAPPPIRLVSSSRERPVLPREQTQRTRARPLPVRALDESAAAREAAEVIQRAKRGAADTRSPGEGDVPPEAGGDGKVIRPPHFDPSRKLH